MEGWIKLYRKFTDWEWYTDSAVKDLFIHLLLSVNHQPKQWRGETIGVGETITSVASLAAETGLSTKAVRTALNKLEKTGEIERKATNRNSLIIVVNYSVYQSFEYDEGQTKGQTKGKPNGKQRANKGQAKGKPTNKNDKNDKNDKNVVVEYGNIDTLKVEYPDIDWEAYSEDDFELTYLNGNVLLSGVQYDLLINRLGIDGTKHYINRLSQWQAEKNVSISNAYATILTWAEQDRKI